MKRCIRILFLLFVLIPSLLLAGRVTAQTFRTLYSFTAVDFNGLNDDGAQPYAGLILLGNTLYGTTSRGSSSGHGTVFGVHVDGTGFSNLHSFTYSSDGGNPQGGLVSWSNALYGTTGFGGSTGVGTVFAINTNGTGFTNLHSFTGNDGAYPIGAMILSGSTLYGIAENGGKGGLGAVFKINTDGTGFTNLHSFPAFVNGTNIEGNSPIGPLVISGDTLYGTASGGYDVGNSTVFKVNTDGSSFTTLYNFTAGSGFFPNTTNSEGAHPFAGMVLSGDTLYGTALDGGSWGNGTVFAVNTNGMGITNLHSFNGSDGASPIATLILSGNTLYGTTTQNRDSSGAGTVFAVNIDGSGFTILHNFTGGSDGADPVGGLVLSDNTLYGTTARGGTGGSGTVFSLSIAPQLNILPSGASVILTWPSNYAGFDFTGFALQSAPTITGTFTNILEATSPYTNPIVGAQQFYRLSK